jgi:glutamate dehydrogenase/leucine dehydrogenase
MRQAAMAVAVQKVAEAITNIHEVLRQPKRVVVVSVPIKKDDGSIKVFTGVR